MNIFFLHKHPEQSAEMLCDKHVPKMLLETCQMLCTAYQRNLGKRDILYKPAYENHPMTRWVGDSQPHFEWAFDHAVAISQQFRKRFGKVHKSNRIIKTIACDLLDEINESELFPDNGFKDPPQCMPLEYKCDDYVQAYRNYYMAEKRYFAKWEKGVDKPAWWLSREQQTTIYKLPEPRPISNANKGLIHRVDRNKRIT